MNLARFWPQSITGRVFLILALLILGHFAVEQSIISFYVNPIVQAHFIEKFDIEHLADTAKMPYIEDNAVFDQTNVAPNCDLCITPAVLARTKGAYLMYFTFPGPYDYYRILSFDDACSAGCIHKYGLNLIQLGGKVGNDTVSAAGKEHVIGGPDKCEYDTVLFYAVAYCETTVTYGNIEYYKRYYTYIQPPLLLRIVTLDSRGQELGPFNASYFRLFAACSVNLTDQDILRKLRECKHGD